MQDQQLHELLFQAIETEQGGVQIYRTAIECAVNDELNSLELALQRLPDCLKPGGHLTVISFHSLEDRLVKHAFRQDSRLRNLAKKPIRPGGSEIASNPRSRSARLRVAQRL